MTETPERADEPATGPVATVPPPPPAYTEPAPRPDPPNRLFQVAAWVAIVAGTLFIVATVFFTGFFMGRHSGGSGGHGGWRQHENGQFHHRGGPQMMPMPFGTGPSGTGGPGAGGPGASAPGAGGSSPTTLPSPAPRP